MCINMYANLWDTVVKKAYCSVTYFFIETSLRLIYDSNLSSWWPFSKKSNLLVQWTPELKKKEFRFILHTGFEMGKIRYNNKISLSRKLFIDSYVKFTNIGIVQTMIYYSYWVWWARMLLIPEWKNCRLYELLLYELLKRIEIFMFWRNNIGDIFITM